MARHEDRSFLEAALAGYQVQLQRITAAIADIQKRLRYAGAGGVPAPVVRTSPPPKVHRVSPEGRRRIREAQLKRWAAVRKATGTSQPSAKKPVRTVAAQKAPVAKAEKAIAKRSPATTAQSASKIARKPRTASPSVRRQRIARNAPPALPATPPLAASPAPAPAVPEIPAQE